MRGTSFTFVVYVHELPFMHALHALEIVTAIINFAASNLHPTCMTCLQIRKCIRDFGDMKIQAKIKKDR